MAIEMQKVKEKARRITRIILWSGLVVAILAAAGYYFWRTYTVSDGTRTGTLYKISRKGYVFKTYEGELQLAGTDMMTQLSVWSFSASDAAVADQLRLNEGKVVTCYYHELVDAFPWQGETDYLVYKVEPVSK
ncbi:MAG: hypothetical protein U0U46_06065 [Saprospiraceae bacterium]|nr:hypothetical protein [Saprospiraceae bacterium]